ncbi:MAG: acetyl-CoA carboxylase biotin carboxylase subunit [Ignavibacteriaceae bacterium]
MFKKILIANRGEIALRIIRACKDLNIKSAAIYSEADKKSLHTRFADEAYLIGAPPSDQSYLNSKKIIKLAKKIKADAIHPGYGFFSENPDFISEVEKAGIVFIGPSSKSVKMMGSKTAARLLMQKHGVPIVPGSTKPIKNLNEGKRIANETGYPVLLKASAGGGGKGMRKILNESEFETAFESTKREALKAFADDSVYIEKFIENPKHIEVQIIADKFGNYRHLFERECSIQRRHQKIIEESPSSIPDEKTRQKITEAAINAAKACNYYNAGTIEFLMDNNNEFYFLEMNTRLQVEHPVTELITGIDLLAEQISIAAGNKISFDQKQICINGHAIECRIYAEDSVNGFLPSTGIISHYHQPSGPGVRVDSGFNSGSEISIYYDPMISKLITWGNNRKEAIRKMNRALSEYYISGLTTNIQFLNTIIQHKDFQSSNYNINFIDDNIDNLIARMISTENVQDEEAAAVFSALLKFEHISNGISKQKSNSNNWETLMYE